MHDYFPLLPFGNLVAHFKQAARQATGSVTPLTVTNIVTNPPGQQEDGGSKGGMGTTPLDMAPSPHLSATEQALGATPEQLQLQEDHTKLQAQHAKTQQQLELAKHQAALARLKPDAPAAVPDRAMGDYKSMQMQLMEHHLKGVNENLKGLAGEAGSLPMSMKLACALHLVERAKQAAEAPTVIGHTAQNYHPLPAPVAAAPQRMWHGQPMAPATHTVPATPHAAPAFQAQAASSLSPAVQQNLAAGMPGRSGTHTQGWGSMGEDLDAQDATCTTWYRCLFRSKVSGISVCAAFVRSSRQRKAA